MTKVITQNEPITSEATCYIGVDISKKTLDVATYPEGELKQLTNDLNGYKALFHWFNDLNAVSIVFESTGIYHQSLQHYLDAQSVPFSLVNPRQTKHFGDAMGKLAKTDKADALMLAKFASLMKPKYTVNKDQAVEELGDLLSARRALLKDQTAAKNRQASLHSALLKQQTKRRLKQITADIKSIDAACKTLIKTDKALTKRSAILTSIPGLGELTATIMLTIMPELGNMDKRQTAALAGLAPITRQSGNWQGKSFIRGGRAFLRQALYMPALVAVRHNPDLMATYKRLIENGKPFKVAIVAVMRKLIITANALLRDDRKWQDNRA